MTMSREECEADRQAPWWKAGMCQCHGDMPGRCPGPANCPMCQPQEQCECCGGDLIESQCAPCNQSRAEGEAFAEKYGVPF